MEALGRRPDSPATWAGRRRRPGTVRTGPGELRCPGGCTCTHRQDHAHGQAPWPSTAASRRGGTAYTGRTELPALQGPLLLDSAPEGGGGRAAGLWLQRRHQGCVGLTAWAPGSVSWGLPATHVVCACCPDSWYRRSCRSAKKGVPRQDVWHPVWPWGRELDCCLFWEAYWIACKLWGNGDIAHTSNKTPDETS
ncbi:PREDICTED: uncharacterized protein LOC106146682 isoform X2 [Chinchilla lanigera]|uniref:uncharacterized protein LOC106146682 isoform X2 n=1 Tax=Chinchilla lanigera TaxID=34839 RepID=UPI000696B565|nr:PREDICTED: uncharacterized protein LOC106146682 isoform X2 [Chinchilla lanigera]